MRCYQFIGRGLIESRSPTLQVDSLAAEPQGKPFDFTEASKKTKHTVRN